MTNVVKFEDDQMVSDRFFRQNKDGLQASADKMQAIIDNPDKSERSKLEAKMSKALFNRDYDEAERIGEILEKLNKSGMEIVK